MPLGSVVECNAPCASLLGTERRCRRHGGCRVIQVMAGSTSVLGMTDDEALKLYETLDLNGDGVLELGEIMNDEKLPFTWTVLGRVLIVLFKVYFTIFIGAVFFMLHPPEVERLGLDWIDSFYFATVVATSIG